MPIRVLLLTSNAPRHRFFAARCAEVFDVVGILSERKKNYYSRAREESELVVEHFKRIRDYEEKYFGEPQVSNITEVDDINNPELIERFMGRVDLVLLYGTSILREQWLSSFETIINLHLGLSPYYKGSATLFWPFYDNNLEFLGATVHLATSEIDGGPILGVVHPDVLPKSPLNYYDITTGLILKSLRIYPHMVLKYLEKKITPLPQTGKDNVRYCRKSDFNEEVLRSVLEKYYIGLETV